MILMLLVLLDSTKKNFSTKKTDIKEASESEKKANKKKLEAKENHQDTLLALSAFVEKNSLLTTNNSRYFLI